MNIRYVCSMPCKGSSLLVQLRVWLLSYCLSILIGMDQTPLLLLLSSLSSSSSSLFTKGMNGWRKKKKKKIFPSSRFYPKSQQKNFCSKMKAKKKRVTVGSNGGLSHVQYPGELVYGCYESRDSLIFFFLI